ncbi:MAG TPA: FAD-dependent oxidoreductase [Gammaproteobacteria bacterium]|nr:FAD-dependent oxidoreductase [Gammaproteobacteria bacterium]
MQEHYDIVIIGGGIHGAGALQAAAAAGYSCLLLEQYAGPAMGTSSRSSKLIHGGLRYLESGEFKLVYECLHERQLLLRNAPSLVKLKPFIIPIYRNGWRGPWEIRAGLGIYSLLAGLGAEVRFKTVPEDEWRQLDGLRQTELRHVYQYADAQTNDAALTAAVIRSAQSLGAETVYKAEFRQAGFENGGYRIRFLDTFANLNRSVTAGAIVNAAGPWVNRVMEGIAPRPEILQIEWIRGSHIILPGPASERIYYLESTSDRRAIFVMPWHGQTMIGTTEQFHFGDPGKVEPSPEEVQYLLGVFNFYFPNRYERPATADMVIESFAGLRVLPKDERNPFVRTRETLYGVDDRAKPRLVAIYGGKLTSYRSTSERVIRMLAPQLPARPRKADTKHLKLE